MSQFNLNLPAYLRKPIFAPTSAWERHLARTIQLPVQAFIWAFLTPRRIRPSGSVLSAADVMAVYNREARRYDQKHHFTTRGQDTAWRREAAACVLTVARKSPHPIRVLDLCTGTGLTIVEVVALLREWWIDADITGLDLNDAMLAVARSRQFAWPSENLRFINGDATKLPCDPGTIDIVTQVFGIGGIPDPAGVFQSVLRVLREGGSYYFVDMHRPIPHFPGEVPLLGAWRKMPWLEATTYELTTKPLALAQLWGWRDPTLDFYRAPLAAHCLYGQWYGFEVMWFKYEVERWWFGLPFMPTARLLVRKVRIQEREAQRRLQAAADLPSDP